MSVVGTFTISNLDMPRFDQPALCAQTDPEMFFPDQHGGGGSAGARAATAVCLDCLARTECLQWALERDERHGVWGGKSPKQRRAILLAAERMAAA